LFGDETAQYFPDAEVVMLTEGDDIETLTDSSEIISTFDGNDEVNAGGGNDKILGGTDVDTLDGQAGNDHIYGFSGNDVLIGGDGDDKIVGGLGDDQISGGSGDDYILAQTGNDTISTGSGSDVVIAGFGDDTITVDGIGDKTIDGGLGRNSLVISYLESADDLSSISYDSDTEETTLVTDAGDTIRIRSIDTLTIGAIEYDLLIGNGVTTPNLWRYSIQSAGSDDERNIGYDGVLFDAESSKVFLFDPSTNETNLHVKFLGYVNSYYPGFDLSTSVPLTITGSPIDDLIDAKTFSNAVVATLGGGNDAILLPVNQSNSVSMGSGDDIVFITSSDGTISSVDVDGGSGTDTIGFGAWDAGGGAMTFTLNSGGVSNFENVVGSTADDTITGDDGVNRLFGGSGSDVLYGLSGDDYIYGDDGGNELNNLSPSLKGGQLEGGDDYGADSLYGGLGDDVIVGDKGDDLLDGGGGADTISTGLGADTVILRTGDGGSTIEAADSITDFTVGTDLFGLDSGLLYSQLTIEQGEGDYSNDTVIRYGSEYLVTLVGVASSEIGEVDFEPVNII